MWDSFFEESFYEFPSFQVAVFSLLLAFVLSSVIAFTYRITYRGISFSGSFFQAMILASISTATIIMAVGNNLAVGFGIVGAIAIIRFRTRIGEPRNIIFIFAAIGVGIASGVYGYAIAVAGTLIYCVVALILFFSPYGKSFLFLYEVNFNLTEKNTYSAVVEFLSSHCDSHFFIGLDESKAGMERYEYRVSLKKGVDHVDFFRDLQAIEGVSNVSIERRNNNERL